MKESVAGSRVRRTVATITGTKATFVSSTGGPGSVSAVSNVIASNGAAGQGVLGASRTNRVEKGAADLGSAGSRKPEDAATTPVRTFSAKDINVIGVSSEISTRDVDRARNRIAADLNVVGGMLHHSGENEAIARHSDANISVDLDDWMKKYKGSQTAFAYAQAFFEQNLIVFNARAVLKSMTQSYRVSQAIHEFRHLMKENNILKSSSSGSPADAIEEDARRFQRRYMKEYWDRRDEKYGD